MWSKVNHPAETPVNNRPILERSIPKKTAPILQTGIQILKKQTLSTQQVLKGREKRMTLAADNAPKTLPKSSKFVG
jgi:hypothetical protein